jgi:hypothetical protein
MKKFLVIIVVCFSFLFSCEGKSGTRNTVKEQPKTKDIVQESTNIIEEAKKFIITHPNRWVDNRGINPEIGWVGTTSWDNGLKMVDMALRGTYTIESRTPYLHLTIDYIDEMGKQTNIDIIHNFNTNKTSFQSTKHWKEPGKEPGERVGFSKIIDVSTDLSPSSRKRTIGFWLQYAKQVPKIGKK